MSSNENLKIEGGSSYHHENWGGVLKAVGF